MSSQDQGQAVGAVGGGGVSLRGPTGLITNCGISLKSLISKMRVNFAFTAMLQLHLFLNKKGFLPTFSGKTDPPGG